MAIYRKESGNFIAKAGNVLIDLALSLNSNRPVANRIVTAKFNDIENNLGALEGNLGALAEEVHGSLDYEHAQYYRAPGTYNIVVDSFVTIYAEATNAVPNVSIKVNGYTMASINENALFIFWSGPVKAGDTIEVTAYNSNRYSSISIVPYT